MKNHLLGLTTLAVVAATSVAQDLEELPPPRAEAFDSALSRWRSTHGQAWQARVDPATGQLEMLYGGNAAAPFRPDTHVESDWLALARHWARETRPMHGIEGAELVDEGFLYLPLGMGNGSDKIVARLTQSIVGVPVENGRMNVLFDIDGRLLALHSTAAPVSAGLSAVPTIGEGAAVRTALERFEADTGVPALEMRGARLLFAQVTSFEVRRALLAYQVSVHNDLEPVGYLYTIDAHSGAVVRRDDEVHYFDVFGTIKSNATPGSEADHAGNPPVETPMSYIDVTSSAGTVQTDRDGNFIFPGVNTPLDITVEYDGQFNDTDNDAGSDYSITFPGVQPGQQNDLLMNPSPSEYITAQANAYQHINVVRDYIRDVNPSDSTADSPKMTSITNIDASCNAFYNGNVNYYRAQGSCNNTAFSSVVAHEFGHGLNIRYGTGNGSDGMGEGNSDIYSMYVYDDPIVGRFFFTSGGFVRTGDNTRQYCGDCCGGCYGGVHADGEVWMGAAWKVRRNLKQTLGAGLGSATSDQLFSGWMNGFNQTQIHSIIEIQWLTLDDDDGDIDNGTPNYDDIDSAFREQGFPGFDLPYVAFSNVTELPDVPVDSGPYTVDADIVAQFDPPVVNPTLFWQVNGGGFNQVAMASTGGDGYTADIPPLGGNGIVQYYLEAQDNLGNKGSFPKGGANDPLTFDVGVPQILASWDFEAADDEGWQGGVPSDDATTGQWERGDPNGTAAQPENDHTPGPGNVQCWFTGQANPGDSIGTNDVDNGRTTLLSPFIDMTGLSGLRIDYWRWYSNDEGASPNADIFEVQVSNGSGWVTAEIVGPAGPESTGGWFPGSVAVENFVAPNSTVSIRFIASDLGNGSIVEAAIDDVQVTFLDGGCPPPTNYCVTSPNSAGAGSLIQALGSQDVNDNSFSLFADGAPPNQFGLFFYGTAPASNPVGDGVMCIGGSLFRLLPAVAIDGAGQASFAVDFANLPPGGGISNGDTRFFQFWYRDPGFGSAFFNFSDGVAVQFCQ